MKQKVILGASAAITDSSGRVLLVLRGKEPKRGLWSLPGGHVERGETLHQTATRETLEETGLSVDVGRELWVMRISVSDDLEYEVHTFAATVTGGTLRAGDDADDARWVSPEELDSLPLTEHLSEKLRSSGLL